MSLSSSSSSSCSSSSVPVSVPVSGGRVDAPRPVPASFMRKGQVNTQDPALRMTCTCTTEIPNNTTTTTTTTTATTTAATTTTTTTTTTEEDGKRSKIHTDQHTNTNPTTNVNPTLPPPHETSPSAWNPLTAYRIFPPIYSLEEAISRQSSRLLSGEPLIVATPAAGTVEWRQLVLTGLANQGYVPAPADMPIEATYTCYPSMGYGFISTKTSQQITIEQQAAHQYHQREQLRQQLLNQRQRQPTWETEHTYTLDGDIEHAYTIQDDE